MSKSIFMIAGEPSGDALGGPLIAALRAQGCSDITGIGGDQMQAQGLESLLPMDELCVMGIWEVLGHLPRLLRLISGVVEEIETRKPDIVVTIDLPDFNFEVAKRLKKRGIFKGKIIHYVAPTVWAWRPGRAKKVSAFLDGLMCLFPFEPAYFEPHGLRAGYAGHPITQIDRADIPAKKFREDRGISQDSICVGALFGSREREFKSHARIIVGAVEALAEQYDDVQMIVPTLPHLEYDVAQLLQGCGVPAHVVVDQDQKWNAFAACNVAIAVSGTVGLELAYMNVPHVIGYKAHPATAMMLKALLKTKYAHLANILLDEPAVPELLQGKCSVGDLTRAMMRLIGYEEERQKQYAAFDRLRGALKLENNQKPSQAAAEFILDA